LGLKGSLNEYELDLLRQRSVEARREKARRGELLVTAPVGYLKGEEHHWEKDPDRRVQEAVLLVFRKFLELGTVRQTLLWFLEHDLQFPVYTRQGETCWKRPSYATIYRILTNPVYGGAYAYGKTEHTLCYENGEAHRGARRKPREQWLALLPNAHEGYVSWEQYQHKRSRKMFAGAGHRVPCKAVPLCWPVCCVAGGVVVSSPCYTLATTMMYSDMYVIEAGWTVGNRVVLHSAE
jgi:hypothetical protein